MTRARGIKVKEPTKKQMLEWLEKETKRYAFLQITHPHLAYIPTNKDMAMFQAIKRLLEEED